MAIFFWQPDPNDQGNPPSNLTIAQPYAPFVSITVVEEGTAVESHSLRLETPAANNERRAAVFTEIGGLSVPDSQDVEIWMKFVASGAANDSRCCGRLDDAASTANAQMYVGGLRRAADRGEISKYVGGLFNTIATNSTLDQGFGVYEQRLRINGNTIRAKIWLSSEPEPELWDLDQTDNDITVPGKVGYFQLDSATNTDFQVRIVALGIGTDGDIAPTASIGTGPQGTVTIGDVATTHTTAMVSYSYTESDEDGFEYRLDGGTPVDIGMENPFTIENLDPDTSYNTPGVEVRAYNQEGEGAWSDPESFATNPEGVTKIAIIILRDETGNPVANESNIEVSWFDGATPSLGNHLKTSTHSTDSNGVIELNVSDSNLSAGQWGYVVATKYADDQSQFQGAQGPVQVSEPD